VRDDRVLYLESGKPMRFGKERQHGLRLNGFEVEIVESGDSDYPPGRVIDQSPGAGAEAVAGSTVKLTVSSGKGKGNGNGND
jgi:beta-lactam-binding protein with PASTA domain